MGFPEREYDKLHKEFGTKALRIAPNQLHISDPSLYKVIYSQINPFPKEHVFYDSFESPHTTFSESDPLLHKQRRKMLNPLFSKSGVNKMEPLIVEKMEQTISKIQRISDAGPIEISTAFRCMTGDIISEFSFGTSMNLIHEHPNAFESKYLKALTLSSALPYVRYYSVTQRIVAKLIPLSIAANFHPVLRHTKNMVDIILASYDDYASKKTERNASSLPVIFDFLQSLPAEQQKAEAINTFIAGSDTTAFTLTTAVYYILSLPDVERTLVEALDEAFGNAQTTPSLVQLEQIKYLRACITEALRVGMAAPGLLPRIVPKRPQPFIVDGKVVPPGTIVGMSAYTMNTDPQIWGPDGASFNPDRWLGPNAKELETYMCTFSKGARQCIGINVAYAEITMTLAHLFYRFKMNLKTKEFRARDRFIQEFEEPGILVDFKLRQHS
ncbi:cytochrome p450 [Fusarium longipes]|uniref:Cytochrome p450 n=1 Tax=Fusarium longipes TaxID=694270 RepID=A0A395T8W1_9HYPO|nr:cytochrome p450 [Fusarium longipes]